VEHAAGPSIGRDLHRLLAGAVADHLERAAALLRQDPNIDALLLGASGTAKVIAVLATAAARIGAPLPVEAVMAIQSLRVLAFTVKDDVHKQRPPPPAGLRDSAANHGAPVVRGSGGVRGRSSSRGGGRFRRNRNQYGHASSFAI
jgi:hypothetical protein